MALSAVVKKVSVNPENSIKTANPYQLSAYSCVQHFFKSSNRSRIFLVDAQECDYVVGNSV